MSALPQSAPHLSQMPAPPPYGAPPQVRWTQAQPISLRGPRRPLEGGLAATHTHNFDREMQSDRTIGDLQKVYVIDDASRVSAFVRWNRLRGLLLEAKEPLDLFFRETAVKRLSLLSDEEGSLTLFCVVIWPGDMQEARRALRAFDERWWLARCQQAAGKLNFDFELV